MKRDKRNIQSVMLREIFKDSLEIHYEHLEKRFRDVEPMNAVSNILIRCVLTLTGRY